MDYAMFEILIFACIALGMVILISRKIKFSKRYDIREMSDWKKLDHGVDPTEDQQ
jgi:hypothetical protein